MLMKENLSNSSIPLEDHHHRGESEAKSELLMFFIAMFILSVSLLMSFYHKLINVAYYIPESTMLITVGVVFGFVIKTIDSDVSKNMRLTPTLFIYYFLPPIVLDASYTLHDRAFSETLIPVLVFAILGTFANFFIVASVLYSIQKAANVDDDGISPTTVLLFSAIISAVDPVAVLAIFKEIGVNRKLYFLVFGESLLNDGVSIVLYEALLSFSSSPGYSSAAVGYGLLLFFVVSIGGVMIGLIGGFVVCIITRNLQASLLLEPVVLLSVAFLAYILALLFHCAGIFALVVCGIMESMYAFENVSDDSEEFTCRALHTIATLSEAVVFLLLGIAVSNMKADVRHYVYAAIVISVCVATRFLIIFFMTFVLARCNLLVERISLTDQFVIAYGGLRGAVAFSLVQLADEDAYHIVGEPMISLTLYVILFTVVPVGLTLKPIVELMEISREQADNMLFAEIGKSIVAYTMAAVESILDRWGIDKIIEQLSYIDDCYVRPILQRDPLSHKKKIIPLFPEPKDSAKPSVKKKPEPSTEKFSSKSRRMTRPGSQMSYAMLLRSRTDHMWGRDRYERSHSTTFRRRDTNDFILRNFLLDDVSERSMKKPRNTFSGTQMFDDN